jgi:hypothetical protein
MTAKETADPGECHQEKLWPSMSALAAIVRQVLQFLCYAGLGTGIQSGLPDQSRDDNMTAILF